jgi:DNA-binding PadR family transcriptional regulator
VYRALAQLEQDGLVKVWDEPAKAGQARKVYGVTESGARVLRAWMGVVKEERDCLDNVLHRYQATGTADAALAQVEGAWNEALGHAWSSVSSTCAAGRRRAVSDAAGAPTGLLAHTRISSPVVGLTSRQSTPPEAASAPAPVRRAHFCVVPDRSVVLIEARSTVGPIRFGAMGLSGEIELDMKDGKVSLESDPAARLDIAVDQLRSGNALYDAELLRRIDARRFPHVSLRLRECWAVGTGDRYRLGADMTFHGVTRTLRDTVGLKLLSDRKLVVTGDHALDARDFHLPSPTVLMLRIYPDVRVNLHVEAERDD